MNETEETLTPALAYALIYAVACELFDLGYVALARDLSDALDSITSNL